MKLYYNFVGCRRLSFDLGDSADVLNICMKYRYPYREMSVEDGRLTLVCTLHTASRLFERCRERNIGVNCGEAHGLPELLFRYRRRYGLILGLLFAVLTVYMSGRVVWDIRVVGNETLTAAEVEAVLSECDFKRGTSISGFEADYTENSALLRCDRIAWISINLKGTVAYVELREKLPIDETPKPVSPANIVASQSGTVIEMIAYDGLATVKAGDEVRAGDLLISGSYGERTPGVRVTRAAGYVLARTVRHFSVEIFYEHTEKIRTGTENQKKYVIFFSKPLKIFVNSGNSGASCDKIEEEKIASLFGVRLPFSLYTETELEYEVVTGYYSEAEAVSLAGKTLDELIGAGLFGAEILSQNRSVTAGERSVVITCELVCIEDIAKTLEFEAYLK